MSEQTFERMEKEAIASFNRILTLKEYATNQVHNIIINFDLEWNENIRHFHHQLRISIGKKEFTTKEEVLKLINEFFDKEIGDYECILINSKIKKVRKNKKGVRV